MNNQARQAILALFAVTQDPCLSEELIIKMINYVPEAELKSELKALKEDEILVAFYGDDTTFVLKETADKKSKYRAGTHAEA